MSNLDDSFSAAESLEPVDRLRLIARLWESLPPEHWASPSESELAEVRRRLGDYETSTAADVPWEIVQRMLVDCARHSSSARKIYSAPRRFDLATIFVVMAAYSILLAGMSLLRFPPVASLCGAGFVTAVGIGQAILFGGQKPRLSSVLAGIVCYALPMTGFGLFSGHLRPAYPGGMLLFVLVPGVFFGAILGYIAGVLVGSVFLVADVLRRRYGRDAGSEDDELADRK